MQPPASTTRAPQLRLKRYIRQPEKLGGRRVTKDKGLAAVAIVERYRFIPSSLLVRLMPGNRRNNYTNLQTLYHKGLINHFALPKYGGPGESIHYLDSKASLDTLIAEGLLPELTEAERRRKEEIIRYNRENNYAKLHRHEDSQGKVLYIQHELMVSRFHAVLEMACRSKKFAGKVFLEQWKQGSELWSRVEVPTVRPISYDRTTDTTVWEELPSKEFLPHRPDAFFTLYFPGKPEGRQRSHFMYEADRGTERTPRYKLKMRAHYHYIVKQQRNQHPPYNAPRIRAVLTETTETRWAGNLREAAKENVVSPKPCPLFWFTSSAALTGLDGQRRYLNEPEIIFERMWHDPTTDKAFDLSAD